MKFKGRITHLSQKGLGVVKNEHNQISYFVFGTWPGDIGEFEVTDKPLNNKKFAYAKLIRLIHPSEQRQSPPCPYVHLEEYGCTGCAWMIADYTSQLDQKRNRFIYAMKRVGFDTSLLDVGAVQPAPDLYGYRNRCQLKTNGTQLGFVSEQSHQIAPIDDCIVLNDACRALLTTVIRQLPNTRRETDANQNWNFIELDDDMHADDIVLNQKRPFKQGNSAQNRWMGNWLRQKLAQNPHVGKVVELFCGSGNFTQLIAASDCTSVIAYEVDTTAIEILKAQHLTNVSPRTIDLFDPWIWKKLQPHVHDAHTLVLDPPRAGLKKHEGFFTSFRSLKTMLYISCNPETFARDAWFFHQQDWSINDVQLLDLFPHTPHVELMAEFIKSS